MDIDKTLKRLEEGLHHWGIGLSEVQKERFRRLTQLLLEWNEKLNLTSITDPERIAIEHFLDSLAPLAFNLIGEERAVIDVGTGAGFPGLPLAIMCPHTRFTLVDATLKKVKYLRETCSELGLTNVEILWGRAEELAHQRSLREGFDVAVTRAFGALDIVWECTLPFVKTDGISIAYKGPKVDEELEIGKLTAPLVGGKIEAVFKFVLPTSNLCRALVVARKVGSAPYRFPRRPGIPEKRPMRLLIKGQNVA